MNTSTANLRRKRRSKIDGRVWLEAALVLLAEGGIDNVRVEPLAKSLGITKGAFYARYADRDDFLGAMLEYWLDESTLAVVAAYAEIDEPPAARLERIFATPFRRADFLDRARMENAIRLWAHQDDRAAGTIARVDAGRLAYIRRVLLDLGHDEAAADARAFLMYGYILTEATLSHGLTDAARAVCRILLCAPTKH